MLKLRSRSVRKFLFEESGYTAVEIVIVLGLVTTAVVMSAIMFTDNLAGTWVAWAEWMAPERGNIGNPPV